MHLHDQRLESECNWVQISGCMKQILIHYFFFRSTWFWLLSVSFLVWLMGISDVLWKFLESWGHLKGKFYLLRLCQKWGLFQCWPVTSRMVPLPCPVQKSLIWLGVLNVRSILGSFSQVLQILRCCLKGYKPPLQHPLLGVLLCSNSLRSNLFSIL